MKSGNFEDERSVSGGRTRMARWPFVLGIVVVAAAIGGMLYLARDAGPDDDAVSAPNPTAVDAPAPETLPPLPPARETDAMIRAALQGVSPLAQLASWLASDDLVRRFVSATNQIADGKSPRAQLGFLGPQEPFRVSKRDGRQYIDPRSFTRYDVVAQVLSTIKTDRAVAAFAKLEPLFERAQQELGARDRTFKQTLAAAIHHLGSTPVPVGGVEVIERHVLFHLAEPQLESLSAAQKHLLRLGPENMRIVQLKLKELAIALRLPPAPETAALKP